MEIELLIFSAFCRRGGKKGMLLCLAARSQEQLLVSSLTSVVKAITWVIISAMNITLKRTFIIHDSAYRGCCFLTCLQNNVKKAWIWIYDFRYDCESIFSRCTKYFTVACINACFKSFENVFKFISLQYCSSFLLFSNLQVIIKLTFFHFSSSIFNSVSIHLWYLPYNSHKTLSVTYLTHTRSPNYLPLSAWLRSTCIFPPFFLKMKWIFAQMQNHSAWSRRSGGWDRTNEGDTVK